MLLPKACAYCHSVLKLYRESGSIQAMESCCESNVEVNIQRSGFSMSPNCDIGVSNHFFPHGSVWHPKRMSAQPTMFLNS